MKSLVYSLLFLFNLLSLNAQCEDGRYVDSLFTVKVTNAIKFGENVQANFLGELETKELFFDLYEPENDDMTDRPMIVLAFGGAFVLGARDDYYMVNLSTHFASLGYVVASIDYRLSSEILINPSDTVTYEAVGKGTHDMRAAVRYFHKEAENLNIDPEQIYVGGVSAGAFAAIHTAYLDKEEEIPPVLQSFFEEWGGLEGYSGNEGYPSTVAGVINLSGAIGDTSWIEPNDLPIVSMHGTNDSIVPYGFGLIEILDINALVYGSEVIHQRAETLGLNNAFYTFQGEGHTPFVNVPGVFPNENHVENYAATIDFVGDFMAELVCAVPTNATMIEEQVSVNVFPNPVVNEFTIYSDELSSFSYTISDINGKLIQAGKAENSNSIDLLDAVESGIYILQVFDRGIPTSAVKLLVE